MFDRIIYNQKYAQEHPRDRRDYYLEYDRKNAERKSRNAKIRYEAKREQILQKQKDKYIPHPRVLVDKEEQRQRHREYQRIWKADKRGSKKVKEPTPERYFCDCGSNIVYSYRNQHFKSSKHVNYNGLPAIKRVSW
eukprot:Lithocolla_globosa_v1_NODE_984_length_2990_cov_16.633731.p2 type:complete len:136 gc:universal NODE_984_length_2990_cov_16.633731:2466-2873(+)